MSQQPSRYRGYRFPPAIIAHAVWLYHRFGLSVRDVEDLLAERGVTVTYETIRQWCLTFGLEYARQLRTRRGRQGGTWYLDEVFVRIRGRQHYLWRAVDEDGDMIDILVQSRRSRRAAIRLFRKLLERQGCEPRREGRKAGPIRQVDSALATSARKRPIPGEKWYARQGSNLRPSA